jgi:hypothetical protein
MGPFTRKFNGTAERAAETSTRGKGTRAAKAFMSRYM